MCLPAACVITDEWFLHLLHYVMKRHDNEIVMLPIDHFSIAKDNILRRCATAITMKVVITYCIIAPVTHRLM